MKNFHRFRTLPRQAKKNILVRYTLFQIPDLVVLALVVLILRRWVDAPSWLMWALVVFWILKDAALFPFVWSAYEGASSDEAHALLGSEGIAEEKLNPAGYVRLHGVLWQARVMEEGTVVNKGDRIVVHGADGLLLKVRPKETNS